jgi:hypothetical protein
LPAFQPPQRRSTPAKGLLLAQVALGLLLACGGCRAGGSPLASNPLTPSHERQWKPLLATLPSADIDGERILVRNVRNCIYFSEEVYIPRFDDRTYRLDELKTVDFIVVPFNDTPDLAHTMLSFGFADGQHLAVSVEARLEEGETYSPVAGALRQFELIYVLGDERDLIGLRTEHRQADVYVYRARVTPDRARTLFLDVLQRVNQIHERPEFYHTITNNCTTNIAQHVNRIQPGRIPPSLSWILTGHSARLAYDLQLLDTTRDFESTRRAAHINALARKFLDAPDFSERIRR